MRIMCGEADNRAAAQDFASVLEVLQWRAKNDGSSAAFTFLHDNGERIHCTYAELERRVECVAAQLRSAVALPARALLVFPSGLEFIYAFYGCLMAGVVAVPAYPPMPDRLRATASQLAAIAKDCEAEVVLTTHEWLDVARCSGLPEPLAHLIWLAIDDQSPSLAEAVDIVRPDPDAVAVLQYTSGSTSQPRGVMLSQRQLLASQEMTCQACQSRSDDIIVGWVPLYHDLGLSGHVLHPVYVGAQAILMSPISFVQKPSRWLEVISEFRATVSGGPNFAYELCARKSTLEDCASLDLSSWRVAANGAEPIQAATIERFAKKFSERGFQANAMMPVYGLAEATLGVTSRPAGEAVTVRQYDRVALQAHRATKATNKSSSSLVSCGRAIGETAIVIVDPQTGLRCSTAGVGEIWVSSPSVGLGYWGLAEESAAVFRAKLEDDSKHYLRTGDLGFLDDGELFVTGRLKDLIIVDGRNHHPQDIELCAQQAHAALRPGGTAAFQQAMTRDDAALKTVLVAELRQDDPALYKEIALTVRSRIADVHGLSIDEMVLIERGALPKTSSGKLRRSATRLAYESGDLAMLASYQQSPRHQSNGSTKQDVPKRSMAAIEHWLRNEVGRLTEIAASDVDFDKSLPQHGLSSKDILLLSGDLGDFIGYVISPEVLLAQQPLTRLVRNLESLDFADLEVQPVADWRPWH